MTAKEAKHESHVRMEYITRHGTGGLENKMTWGQNGGAVRYGWRSSVAVEDMNR